MTIRSRHAELGFTLLEALVAVALVAGGATVTMRVLRLGARTVASDAAHTEALVLAMDMLARARLAPPPIGEYMAASPGGVTIERRVRPIAVPGLLEVTVRATPHDGRAGIELTEIVRATRN